MAKRVPKAHRQFLAAFAEFMESLHAEPGQHGYQWRIATKAGSLDVQADDPDRFYTLTSVFTRFENPEAAAPLTGCSRVGKWNHHIDWNGRDVATTIEYVISQFRRLL